MKNLLLVVLTTALLFSCSNSENYDKETTETVVAADSGWATNHLKGMVKTIEEAGYTPDDNGTIGEMDSCCIELRVYNEKGYTINYSEKERNGTLAFESNYERIDGAKFKSRTDTKNGKHIWSRTTHYDADGKTLYVEDTDSTKQVHRIYSDITENEIGQALQGKAHTADSIYLGTWSFKYIDGMRAGGGWIDSTGTQLNDRTGELNDKGFLAKMTRKIVGDDGNATTTVETYTYDSFDETGNWTQRTRSIDDKVTKVEKRTYTYF